VVDGLSCFARNHGHVPIAGFPAQTRPHCREFPPWRSAVSA